MIAIIALIIAFFLGLLLRLRGMNEYIAWLLSCLVMPTLLLFDEFVLPYTGDGASLWPLPLIFGGFYGIIAGGLGSGIGSFHLKRKKSNT
jgi:hypothetical protein